MHSFDEAAWQRLQDIAPLICYPRLARQPARSSLSQQKNDSYLPLTDRASLKPGDIFGMTAVALIHVPLETCVADPPAPSTAPRAECSVNCVNGPYFDLVSSSPPHAHIVDLTWPTSDPPGRMLQRHSFWQRCGTNFHHICATTSLTLPVREPCVIQE